MSTGSTQSDLILDLLAWLADGGRPYTEVMARWRTSCPRLSIWEDAIAMGLVDSVDRASTTSERVVLTAEGRHVVAEGRTDLAQLKLNLNPANNGVCCRPT